VELERTAVALRPRGDWEALDLGFHMARAWWPSVWRAWLVVYLPAAVAAHLAFPESPFYGALLLWWLKPLFDRVVLHVLARGVFGDRPGLDATLRTAGEWLRPGWLAGLIWRRLDLARSFTLPVWQLERQRGAAARGRRRVLGQRLRGQAVWLTVVCAHFEFVVMVSLGLALDLLQPGAADTGFDWQALLQGDAEDAWTWVDSACYVAAVSLVEPFYVGGGFSLYLNRRTLLEAWDVEVPLRRLGERLAAARQVAAAAVLGLLAAAVPSLAPEPAFATEPALAAEPAPGSVRAELAEVLKAPEFQAWRETTRWRYRGGDTDLDDDPEGGRWRELGLWLGRLVRLTGWLALAALVVVALVFLRRFVPPRVVPVARPHRPPDALFGLSVAPATLPDDVAGVAAALLDRGRQREALSLLYRGALSVLVHRDRLRLADGDTEGDCLRAACAALPGPAGAYFAVLVRAWQGAAYAGRAPEPQRAAVLCQEWAAHFGARSETR